MIGILKAVAFMAVWTGIGVNAGSQCHERSEMYPWLCFTVQQPDSKLVTMITCQGEYCLDQRISKYITVAPAGIRADLLLISDVGHSSNVPIRFPSTWVKQSRVKNLEVRDSQLTQNFLAEDTFSGQEDFMEKILVANCSIRGQLCGSCSGVVKGAKASHVQKRSDQESNSVPMAALKILKALKHLEITRTSVTGIDNDVFPSTLLQLHTIILTHNDISNIANQAFAKLPALHHLDLSHNRISAVARSWFDKDDKHLTSINLSWNDIDTIPQDFFLGMHNLSRVNMNYNQLRVLPVSTWTPLYNNFLSLDADGNFFHCDCDLMYTAHNLTTRGRLDGECSTPQKVEQYNFKAAMYILNCTGISLLKPKNGESHKG